MSSIIDAITQSLQNNQFFTGMFSVWILGVITYLFRNTPKKLFHIIKYNFTTSMELTNSSEIYGYLLEKLSKIKGDKFRKLQITRNTNKPTIGLGLHFIKIKNKIVKIYIERRQSYTRDAQYICTLTILGRNKTFFENLINEIREEVSDLHSEGKLMISARYIVDENIIVPSRTFDSIFIDKNIIDRIINKMNFFINNEQWYLDRGIPYQLNIMIHGSAGTGKTSLIKAIANHYKKNIKYISNDNIKDVLSEIESNEKDLIIFEDIDASKNVSIRGRQEVSLNDENNERKKDNTNQIFELIINTMDGLLTRHGNIFIFTTNHLSQLDDAFLRSSRMDLVVEIPYITINEFNKFLSIFYDKPENINGDLLKDNLTIADLQDDFTSGFSKEEIIKKYVKIYNPIKWKYKKEESKYLLLKN